MIYEEKNQLRDALMDLKPYMENHLRLVQQMLEQGDIPQLLFEQARIRLCVMQDVIKYWNHYALDTALILVAPIMIDLWQIGDSIDYFEQVQFDEKLSALETIFKQNGFAGKHPLYKIPIRLH